jgi:hypothetical protein
LVCTDAGQAIAPFQSVVRVKIFSSLGITLLTLGLASCTPQEVAREQMLLEVHFRFYDLEVDTRENVLRRLNNGVEVGSVPFRFTTQEQLILLEDIERYGTWNLPDTFISLRPFISSDDATGTHFLTLKSKEHFVRTAWFGDILRLEGSTAALQPLVREIMEIVSRRDEYLELPRPRIGH